MSDDALRLNSIGRFSKSSPEYVLEEHSHCEVPAGCGGAVLRWRNPKRNVPVGLWSYSPAQATLLLDGATPTSSRPLLPYGEHVLAWTLTECDPSYALLYFAAFYDPQRSGQEQYRWPPKQEPNLLTAADTTWRYMVTPPPDGWELPGFDDQSWSSLTSRPAPPLSDPKREPFQLRHLREIGAEGLGIDTDVTTAWVRKVMVLTFGGNEGA
jgi:hypothetical protein